MAFPALNFHDVKNPRKFSHSRLNLQWRRCKIASLSNIYSNTTKDLMKSPTDEIINSGQKHCTMKKLSPTTESFFLAETWEGVAECTTKWSFSHQHHQTSHFSLLFSISSCISFTFHFVSRILGFGAFQNNANRRNVHVAIKLPSRISNTSQIKSSKLQINHECKFDNHRYGSEIFWWTFQVQL